MYKALCLIDEFDDLTALNFEVDAQSIFVIKHENAFHAYLNRCPHQGKRLNENNSAFVDMEDELIRCDSHEALFDISSGSCVSGPCSGSQLTKLNTQIRSNTLFIELG
jgi:nitrite reductase/ring-hydroxylating ferredoxin subunit